MRIIIISLFFFVTAFGQSGEMKLALKLQNAPDTTISLLRAGGSLQLMTDGRGEAELSFRATGELGLLNLSGVMMPLYLDGGLDLLLMADAVDVYGTISFAGTVAAENNFMVKTVKELSDIEPVKDEKQFKEQVSRLRGAIMSRLGTDVPEGKSKQFLKNWAEMNIQNFIARKSVDNDIALLEGNAAPPFEGCKDSKGKNVGPNDFKGRYVYLIFWASWCKPCHEEFPAVRELQKKYSDTVAFVSISIDKDIQKWQETVNSEQLGGVHLFADNYWDSKVNELYAVTSIPRYLLIGPDGKVVDADAKRPSDPGLRTQLDKLVE